MAQRLPARIETVILALDMSGSMRATDIEPTRLVAAQAAAKSFVDSQPRHVKIGVVGIAASAALEAGLASTMAARDGGLFNPALFGGFWDIDNVRLTDLR